MPKIGSVPDNASAAEHREWARKLWTRLDRDGSGYLTREELNCDEMQAVFRSVIAPTSDPHEVVSGLARSGINIKQALDFILRKADMNFDGKLSFKEFCSFLRVLKGKKDARQTAKMIFALFDLDGSNTIDKEEFKGVYRYYYGNDPTLQQLLGIFLELDPDDTGVITLEQYIRWLKHTDMAMKQFVDIGEEIEGERLETKANPKLDNVLTKGLVKPSSAFLPYLRKVRQPQYRAGWNERPNAVDFVNMTNPGMTKGNKIYFSRPQSLPELSRFYDRHPDRMKDNARRFHTPQEVKKQNPAVVVEPILPGRYVPDGTMINCQGRNVMWMDDWQTPSSFEKKAPSALNYLRCEPVVPDDMKYGRDYKLVKARLGKAKTPGGTGKWRERMEQQRLERERQAEEEAAAAAAAAQAAASDAGSSAGISISEFALPWE
eukprot:TRINITY_DN101772_c0_g1_i1.p1 TRINITY_DN101772_c0_g1~~TRINITY_DN101772_c0_g1_i1.p1  ORF type:complete len:433 (-),score=112.95 TRINITY_DN101772_c0_g1_i1:370-1668(-)